MDFCKKNENALFFSSINEIPTTIWDILNCSENNYFSKDFLASIEKNHSEISFIYVVLVDDKKQPKAFASIQIVDFYLNSVDNKFEDFASKLKTVARKLHIFPDKKPLKLLICGNTFVSGEHGIFIKQNNDKKIVIKELAKAILHFVNADKHLKIDAFLLKDFINESLFIADELKDYNPFSVEPNMVLHVAKNWQNFDDYLAAMKTKFRVKAKKAIQLSASIYVENVTLENIDNSCQK